MNKFIVIEGGDGAGKGTQAKLLVEKLIKEAKVSFFDFPQYEKTLAGKLVGRYLKGLTKLFFSLKFYKRAFLLDGDLRAFCMDDWKFLLYHYF